MAKKTIMVNLEELDTVSKTHAMHNRLHAEYLDARHSKRTKATIAADHQTVVKHLLSQGGKHLPKGDSLDKTLARELIEPVTLRYLSDGIILAEEGETSTSEIQILRTGTFHHPFYGKFTITDDTLQHMVANYGTVRPKSPTQMVVDFEHLSTGDVVDPMQGRAAGWFVSVRTEEGKLFATVSWTDEAAEAIKEKKFQFISPEFSLNYIDKESGEDVGPTILSAALTNRPFLEGMEPVVLSETLGSMIFAEESFDEKRWDVTRAYRDLYDGQEYIDYYIEEVFEEHVIVSEGAQMYFIPYFKDDVGVVTFDMGGRYPVNKVVTYEPVEENTEAPGIPATQEVDGEPGRLSDNTGNKKTEETMLDEKQIREALGLSEDADVMAAIAQLKTESTDLTSSVATLTEERDAAQTLVSEATAEGAVVQALTDRKITPKMRTWAKE